MSFQMGRAARRPLMRQCGVTRRAAQNILAWSRASGSRWNQDSRTHSATSKEGNNLGVANLLEKEVRVRVGVMLGLGLGTHV